MAHGTEQQLTSNVKSSALAKLRTLTVDDLCELLQYNPQTIRRLVSQGKIKKLQSGTGNSMRGWRFTIAEYERYLESIEQHDEVPECQSTPVAKSGISSLKLKSVDLQKRVQLAIQKSRQKTSKLN